jgi:hypothetical protein
MCHREKSILIHLSLLSDICLAEFSTETGLHLFRERRRHPLFFTGISPESRICSFLRGIISIWLIESYLDFSSWSITTHIFRVVPWNQGFYPGIVNVGLQLVNKPINTIMQKGYCDSRCLLVYNFLQRYYADKPVANRLGF